MKLLLILCSLIFTSSIFATDTQNGCIAITKNKLCIQLEWTQGPYVGSFSKNIIRFKDLNLSEEGKTIYTTPKQSVQFFGWMVMQGHSHGTRPVLTNLLSSGIYENTQIFYMQGMKGSWQFKLKLGQEEFVLHALDL